MNERIALVIRSEWERVLISGIAEINSAIRPRGIRRRLPQAPSDAGFVQVVRRHFHFHAIAGGESDPAFAHFAADGGEHHVFIVEFHAEHGSGQYGVNAAFDFDMFFSHSGLSFSGPK